MIQLFRLVAFSALVGPRVPHLDDMSAAAARRPASPLEKYLLARLEGARSSPWLDGLEFYPAAKLCEITGAVALFGRTPNLHKLSDADWHAAGGAGFEIASGGEASFRAFLSQLQATSPKHGTRTRARRPSSAGSTSGSPSGRSRPASTRCAT